MQLLRNTPSFIGLDIGTSMVKAVKMTQKGKQYILDKFAIEKLGEGVFQAGELKNPSSLAQTAKAAVAKCDKNMRDVIIALPNNSILSDVITIDLVPKKQIREAVMVEAGRLSPFDMSEVEIDYEVLERNEDTKQMKVLMVAAKHDIIYSFVDCMNEAGLRPTIIDVDLFALINIFGLNYELDNYRSIILVNIGMESTDAAFLQNGKFHSSRDIPVTGTTFYKNLENTGLDSVKIHNVLNGNIDSGTETDRIIAALNSTSKEFANAIGVAVSYFQSSDGIDHIDVIVLAGGFSHIPGLANILELRTGAEALVLDPLRNITFKDSQITQENREKTGTMLAVAMGLAIRK